MIRRIQDRLDDVKNFGPGILASAFKRPNREGVIRINTRLGKFYVRPGDSDMKVLRQVYVDRQYDLGKFPQGEWVHEHCAKIRKEGKVPLIIDAGANAGFSARFFAETYPSAKVIAIEPDLESAELCRWNTAHIDMGSGIVAARLHTITAAVGSREGMGEVKKKAGESWSARIKRNATGVPIMTIRQIQGRLPKSVLLLVKVDIEGFERDLFADSTDWVQETKALIVEPHDWMLPGERSSWTMQLAVMKRPRDMLILGDSLAWIDNPA